MCSYMQTVKYRCYTAIFCRYRVIFVRYKWSYLSAEIVYGIFVRCVPSDHKDLYNLQVISPNLALSTRRDKCTLALKGF